jgi:hypothetical protein
MTVIPAPKSLPVTPECVMLSIKKMKIEVKLGMKKSQIRYTCMFINRLIYMYVYK